MKTVLKLSFAAAGSLAVIIAVASSGGKVKKDISSKTSEASVVTNENGSVSKLYTESSVITNGSMVTEHRRETRTTSDSDGNVLSTATSEYAHSYPVGEESVASLSSRPDKCAMQISKAAGPKEDHGSFMGLKFGEEFKSKEFSFDPSESLLLRARFTPKKPLKNFDDYYVYVTPVSHKIAKVYACAKQTIDPNNSWRSNYLIEALEKRYNTWARLRSWCRPIYSFDIGFGRYVSCCLSGASENYETVVVAWDEAAIALAQKETHDLKVEAQKKAVQKRRQQIDDAFDAF